MTAAEERAWVEKRWERATVIHLQREVWANWHAAFLFTQDYERQIAEAREAIAMLEHMFKSGLITTEEHPTYRRILSREQAALTELLRGFKEVE